MTTSSLARATAGPADRGRCLETLVDQLPRFARLIHAAKAAHVTEGRDRAALVLLYPLVRLGPLRQGALADQVHADPSTISRHVTLLVERGLVTRTADETDGRASRLVVTDAGREALDQLRRERETQLDRALADWNAADLAAFTTLFGRLLDDLAAELPGMPGCPAGPATTAPREK